MNVFVFILCIVGIVFTAETVQKIYKIRSGKNKNDVGTGEALAQLEVLEERIRVLERIVTESKYDLKKEINRL